MDVSQTRKKLIWDAHACPTIEHGTNLSYLDLYYQSGFTHVSLNVGFEASNLSDITRLVDEFTNYINSNSDRFTQVSTPQDVLDAKSNNKLAISFDIEGLSAVKGNLSAIKLLCEKGVKQFSLVYNKNNFLGGGCQDNDIGLTDVGYHVIDKLNDAQALIDCSHNGEKTSLDIISYSKAPVIFSHSNPKALNPHYRNISDKQVLACAKKGGVIGLNGISLFMKNGNSLLKAFIEQYKYLHKLVGPDHIGLGSDYVFELEKTLALVENHPENFPNPEQYYQLKMISPVQIHDIANEMKRIRISETDIDKFLGLNFHRVTKDVW